MYKKGLTLCLLLCHPSLLWAGSMFDMPKTDPSQDATHQFLFGAGTPHIDALSQFSVGLDFLYSYGAEFSTKGKLETPVGNSKIDVDFNTKHGYGASPKFGFRYNHLRVEEAIRYLTNDLEDFDIAKLTIGASGKVDSAMAMTNFYYDILDPREGWVPFVGIGLGVGRIDFKVKADTTTGTVLPKKDISGDHGAFVYQGIVGLGYAPNENWRFDLSATYFDTSTGDWTVSLGGVSLKFQPDYHNLTIGLGLSYFI